MPEKHVWVRVLIPEQNHRTAKSKAALRGKSLKVWLRDVIIANTQK